MRTTRRPLVRDLALLAATVTLGLATRRWPAVFPSVLARYGGDALWAAMVFWLLSLCFRAASTVRLGIAALGIAWGVELSQLYRAPWIDAARATRAGALVLGQGFLWSDLLCYAVGVLLAAGIDAVNERRDNPR